MPSNWSKSSIRGLVCTLRVGDHFKVNGGELTIEVVDVKGRWLRLAFASPKDIKFELVRSAHKTLCKVAGCEVCSYLNHKSLKGEENVDA